MSSKAPIHDIEVVKKELEKEMIKGILEYVKNGTFPNNSPRSYANAYELVYNMANVGENEVQALLAYYIQTIKEFIEDCHIKVSRENTTQLIDSFIKHTESITFLFIG